jgi:hypothetical protein
LQGCPAFPGAALLRPDGDLDPSSWPGHCAIFFSTVFLQGLAAGTAGTECLLLSSLTPPCATRQSLAPSRAASSAQHAPWAPEQQPASSRQAANARETDAPCRSCEPVHHTHHTSRGTLDAGSRTTFCLVLSLPEGTTDVVTDFGQAADQAGEQAPGKQEASSGR